MKIGILGTGIVARTIGQKLMDKGHGVMCGTRDVEKTLSRKEPDRYRNPPFSQWKMQHPEVNLGKFRKTAAYGEVIFNATNGSGSLAALRQAGKENLRDKILIDLANPLDFSNGFPPSLTVCNTDSLGEQIQANFPETRVVKTLNTMNCSVMVNPELVPGDHTVFVSGNDEAARDAVSRFLADWFGWKPENIIELGDITTARAAEMLLPIWAQLYSLMQNPAFNFHIAVGQSPAA